MPTYSYHCSGCGRTKDLQVPIDFRHILTVTCSDCKLEMDRLPSAPAFKVTGFNAKNGYSK